MNTALLATGHEYASRSVQGGARSTSRKRQIGWNFAEWFVLGQTFFPALLYIPGSQPFRVLIRLFAYAIPLAALAYYSFIARHKKGRVSRPHPATPWLILALTVLGVMLLHPTTNTFLAGLAQIGLYLAVMSPVFWAPAFVKSPERLRRLLWLLLICNGINSLVGVMQVRDPGTWMPREFSSNITQTQYGLDAVGYAGAGGRTIIRPPGLGDAPGQVAGPAVFALFLGLVFALTNKVWWKKLLSFLLAWAGGAAIFLSFVRASFLIAIGMTVVYFLVQLQSRRIARAATFALVVAAVITVAFISAAATGGQSLVDRFQTLLADNPVNLYNENRGNQVANAFSELLPQYPFGAGLGRWGMMLSYFGNSTSAVSPPIWVEIQWPAFIVDGGILLLLLYPVGVVIALSQEARLSFGRGDRQVKQLAALIFSASCGIFALCFSYPVFLAPIGMQFWFLAGGLHGVKCVSRRPATKRTAVKPPSATSAV